MWDRLEYCMSSSKLFITAILILSLPVCAHLDSGEDRTVGEYIVDFGYSPEKPVADESAAFAINIANKTSEEAIEADTWVRISSPGKVLFAGTLADNSFSFVFPEGGQYEITARFSKGGVDLAQASFDIDVEGNPGYLLYVAGAAMFILGFAASLLLRKSMKS